jgi:hypothetical protein
MGTDHALGLFQKEAMHGHESAFFWVGNPFGWMDEEMAL